ncbi:MAG: DUF4270 domain-containing protein [Tannerella sp.]|jgi:hypothetical protein|nr:DUF4270 domain-containing protein [Tannerella sp.]
MTFKRFIGVCTGAGWIFLSSCSDTWNLVGPSIQPDEDRITVYTDTFQMAASTVKIDSVFAKTTYGYLGEFYDPLYGRLKSDYLCQFYCSDNFQFAYTPYKGKIDSVTLHLEYTSWTGNPYAPTEIQVYPVNRQLDKVYYSNIEASDYCDMQHMLASLVASPALGTIFSSSAISETDTVYYRRVAIRLPLEFGQKIYDETVQNPSTFENQETFNRFLPGFYVTTGYGSGVIFHINRTEVKIDYQYALESSTGTDSLIANAEWFTTTKDVIQLNRFEDENSEQLLEDNDEYTFLKTPAGIFTRLVIPAGEIRKVINDRMVNDLLLELRYMPQEELTYTLAPPPHLLLLPEDSLTSFFENGNLENGVISYLSTSDAVLSPTYSYLGYNSDTRTYSFKNISNLLNYHIAYSEEADLRLLVVPVNRTYQEYSSSYSSSGTTYYTTGINSYLAPSGVKLRKDEHFMQIAVLSSKYPEKPSE